MVGSRNDKRRADLATIVRAPLAQGFFQRLNRLGMLRTPELQADQARHALQMSAQTMAQLLHLHRQKRLSGLPVLRRHARSGSLSETTTRNVESGPFRACVI